MTANDFQIDIHRILCW